MKTPNRWPAWAISFLALVSLLVAIETRGQTPATMPAAKNTCPFNASDTKAISESYAFEGKQKYEDALAELAKLGDEAGKSYFCLLRKAWLQYCAGKYDESVRFYEQAASVERNAVEPLQGMTLPQMARGDWKAVEKSAASILAIDPKNYTGLIRAAQAQYSLGKYDKAAQFYRDLLGLYPVDSAAINGLAWCQMATEQYSSAAELFRKLLAVYPAMSDTNYGLGWALYYLKDYKSASACFELFLKTCPASSTARSGLAWSCYFQKQYEFAAKYFNENLTIYDKDSDAISGLAWSYFYLGKQNDAAIYFQKLLQIKPDDKSAKLALDKCKK